MTHTLKATLALAAIWAVFGAPTFAQPPVPPAAAATDARATPALETNPAVRAALEIPRETPADYFQAITWLIELERPQLAKPILDELVKLQLTDADRAALVEHFGPHEMLQLAQAKELAPAGAEFANACMNAATAAANDPQRIAALLAQLTDPSAETRTIARNDLVAIGQPGVTATLEALAKETDPNRRTAIADAAARMNPLVVGPLLAMLDTSDPALRSTVAQLLRELSVMQAVPLLPQSLDSAERTLTTTLSHYRRGTWPFATDADDRVELWQWNDAAKKLSSQRYPSGEARTLWMARLARALAQYFPENRDYARQSILLDLEAAAIMGAPNTRAIDELRVADPALLDEILCDALASNYAHAAIATASAIAERGNADVLISGDGQPAPLARALHHPDRGVRFAALQAIMKLDPTSPYPGSSHVPEALAWFAASTGERRAIVAMPTESRATDLANMLTAVGFQATATDSGRQAIALALETPDLEMILVDVNVNGPAIRDVIYELRINPTTAEIPIAILAPTSRLAAAEQIASEHERVLAAPRVSEPATLARLTERLVNQAGRFAPSAEVRTAQAEAAMAWLAKLAAGERPFYKIRRAEPVIEAALYGKTTASPAVVALAKLGTPETQSALVDYASQPTLPLNDRRAAADAFRSSVAEHGLLLTSQEILAQYDRYNASEQADAGTQRVLGALLDTIESRNPPLSDNVDSLPSPALP